MKRIIIALFTVTLLISIYIDLTDGTLPVSSAAPEKKAIVEVVPNKPHFTATVQPGQTLLSIVEKKHGKSSNVSIAKLVSDFQSLNSGASPEKLQIGKEYRFPVYGY
ncbi:FimV family protein [Bacillus sp. FJAT-27445]|uniref:type IV pilus assembly protein FimV n=1 Tax=Bacillus sp. FJAT-27445 TaxID=1679166 RepID=UPI0007433064|nr:LysM domain-containing protein [Bacillus sp. FJAT-27445]